jgi:hypothetical protein
VTDRPVTDVWVDDEFDVVRSRGLQPTSRLKATTSEGDIPNLVSLASFNPTLSDLDLSPASDTA